MSTLWSSDMSLAKDDDHIGDEGPFAKLELTAYFSSDSARGF